MRISRVLTVAFAALMCMAGSEAMAQKKKEVKLWEESNARKIEPEIRMFVTPQICDMKMLSSSREVYGPYAMDVRLFSAKAFSDVTNGQLTNMQSNAAYLASKEAGADAIIEPVFHSWVLDGDDKTVYIELSGYPVSYYNFRPATKSDIEMIGVVYPTTNSSIMVNSGSSEASK
ncbi:MAG: hypothetical protein K2L14_03900 [Duncaniella sp.]|nr:hypothetical protein [Duncaniella sp.]